MTLQQSKHAPAILRHFGGTAPSEFLDIVADVLARALDYHEENPEEDTSDSVTNAINDFLIYYVDQWEIMKFYQSPEDANLSDAIELLSLDILAIMSEIDNQ